VPPRTLWRVRICWQGEAAQIRQLIDEIATIEGLWSGDAGAQRMPGKPPRTHCGFDLVYLLSSQKSLVEFLGEALTNGQIACLLVGGKRVENPADIGRMLRDSSQEVPSDKEEIYLQMKGGVTFRSLQDHVFRTSTGRSQTRRLLRW